MTTVGGAVNAKYELTVVHRLPQASSAPVFTEIDPIEFTGLSYTDELNKAQVLDASCLISSLTDPIIQRLRSLHENPSELWLYRNNEIVFAGPLLGWSAEGDSITFKSQGLLTYLRWMMIDNDYDLVNQDIFTVARLLVEQFQGIEYGHYGIETDGDEVGYDISIQYVKSELIHVDKALEDLAKANRFDFEVVPSTRNLQLWDLAQGTDRSTGDSAIVFDASNIDNWNAQSSCGPEDYGNLCYATSTDTEVGTLLDVLQDANGRALFGAASIATNFDKITTAFDLSNANTDILLGRNQAFLVPGPTVRVTADTDLSLYGIGDTVSYVLNDRLGISGDFRLRKRTVNVNQSGRELVTLEFV